jgi:superfamily I DNA/RNA helicase
VAEPRLNRAQKHAVEHANGPMLVLAGAGSGKTRVITHRIMKLLASGVPAGAICALTFTNKAAAEMRERVAALLRRGGAGAARAMTIATFHAFGLTVLSRERAAIGGAFTIFDQGDQVSLAKEILRGLGASKSYDAPSVLARISNAKNAFVSPEELAERDGDDYDEITSLVYPRYQAALRRFRAYDFDDLVCEVARLWAARKDVLMRWQKRFHHVLVDEYQDTNRAQLELLLLLAGAHKNVCVVGDDDQAIYGWRGADVRNILEFEAHFPGAVVVKLEQNYRSRAPILDVANAVIARRTDAKYRKTLFTDKVGGDKVALLVAPSPDVEAKHVAKEVRRAIRDEGRKAREVAVLYRSNAQSKLVEEMLREHGIPHRVVGGQQFFDRKEVKDLLAYAKLLVNPRDDIALRRIINYPARGIGETSLERLALHATARDWTLMEAVERVDALDDVAGVAREGCKSLESVLVEMRRALLVRKEPPSTVVRALAERIGLKREIEQSSPSSDAAQKRWGNVEGLFQTFARREAQPSSTRASTEKDLLSFLQALTLDASEAEEEAGDVVTLSTLHGSKGLEFELVFLIGCEEGFLPHARTLDARATDIATEGATEIEEERRLFYVGVTRARERLTLSRAKARILRGKPVLRTPSRFLLDIPPELLDEREVADEAAMTASQMVESADALLAALESLG